MKTKQNNVTGRLLELIKNQADALGVQSEVLLEQTKRKFYLKNKYVEKEDDKPKEENKQIKKEKTDDLTSLLNIENNKKISLVYESISKISGYQVDELQPEYTIDEIGFDSMMLIQLINQLKTAGFKDVEINKLSKDTSIRDIINIIGGNSDIKEKIENKFDEDTLHKPGITANDFPKKISPVVTQYKARIEFPENYKNMQKQLAHMQANENPYFRSNTGVNRAVINIENKDYINYSSFNYLGLSGNKRVSEATKMAIDVYGTSVSGSRLLSGEIDLHSTLEDEISSLIGTESSIVYVSGHATNVSSLSHLITKDDLILYDELCHNSIIEGAIFSNASRQTFRHNDCNVLEKLLQKFRPRYKNIYILIEGVYSMDGDIANLPEIINLKKKYGAILFVDEAHSIGVLGERGAGITEYFNVNPDDGDLWMGTLSKSLSSCGGYIAGKKEIIDYLKWTSPGFIFSVGISPASVASAIESIRILKSENNLTKELQYKSGLFLSLAKKMGLNTGKSENTPIIPIIVGNSTKCLEISQYLFKKGINVHPILYPAVPEEEARLRFFITTTHTKEHIFKTIDLLKKAYDEVCNKPVSKLENLNIQ